MTLRSKNILLVIGFVLVLILAYNYSFSKTFTLRNQINELKAESVNSNNVSSLNAQFLLRERYADSILRQNNMTNSSVQNSLLEFLNLKTNNESLKIIQFDPAHSILDDQGKLVSYRFKLQGPYDEAEKLLFNLEQEYSYGETYHVNFEKKRDYRKRKNYLECEVILRNFEN